MAANGSTSAATHFGRQMRKERVAHGWSLREFSARSGIDFTTASRIENGKRPPTEAVAAACDAVFPGRRGWFSDYYEESKSWVPAGFRSWAEYEDKAVSFSDWWPSVISGLVQTEDYARAHLSTLPGVTDDIVAARLANRLERQRRVLMKEDPPLAWFVVDQMALYRLMGSHEIMAEQMRRLSAVAAMPNVTMQVLPAVGHAATASGFMVTGDSAYVEHLIGGLVYTDEETVTRLARQFDSLRAECYRASESATIIEKAGELWTGAKRATVQRTAGRASKSGQPQA